jgi:hypothetical protein
MQHATSLRVPSGDAEGAREPMTISLEIHRPPKASSLPFISRKSASPVGSSKKYYTICRVSWRKNFGLRHRCHVTAQHGGRLPRRPVTRNCEEVASVE